jgi:hypothetical protein
MGAKLPVRYLQLRRQCKRSSGQKGILAEETDGCAVSFSLFLFIPSIEAMKYRHRNEMLLIVVSSGGKFKNE